MTRKAAELFLESEHRLALTGAGISVAAGIPDFRSPGGIWSRFEPDEFATIEAFLETPEKAWEFYRSLGETLAGRMPTRAHRALAELEALSLLAGLITQNIDGLHQDSGSTRVFEVHGDHRSLECLRCGVSREFLPVDLSGGIPHCLECGFPLKPGVVLFGEQVREIEAVSQLVSECSVLLVIGTSVQVYPSGGIPDQVRHSGGRVFEFNREETRITASADFVFQGEIEETVPGFVAEVRRVIDEPLWARGFGTDSVEPS